MLQAAAGKDAGFDVYVLTQMVARAEARPDADSPLDADALDELRRWARDWRTRLAARLLS